MQCTRKDGMRVWRYSSDLRHQIVGRGSHAPGQAARRGGYLDTDSPRAGRSRSACSGNAKRVSRSGTSRDWITHRTPSLLGSPQYSVLAFFLVDVRTLQPGLLASRQLLPGGARACGYSRRVRRPSSRTRNSCTSWTASRPAKKVAGGGELERWLGFAVASSDFRARTRRKDDRLQNLPD